MLDYLKQNKKKVLNMIDINFCGSPKTNSLLDLDSLLVTFENILTWVYVHDWRFKSKKLKYRFDKTELLDMIFSDGRIQIARQWINIVIAL